MRKRLATILALTAVMGLSGCESVLGIDDDAFEMGGAGAHRRSGGTAVAAANPGTQNQAR